MKIDRETVAGLLSLNDDKLWRMIRLIASGAGIDMSAFPRQPENMTGLRAALGSLRDEDIERAREIIDIYSGKGGTGR